MDPSRNTTSSSFDAQPVKGPKRKRLEKACDACHKSKRRCDGTAPCSNCFYASKNCSYTDSSGRPVPAPRQLQHPHEERSRKRYRHQDEAGGSIGASGADEHPLPVQLDPATIRELTNLFFAHCHPALVIIHKPTFTSALSHNLVPPYLLHALCALAAGYSKQPILRTSPSRMAGRGFAEQAKSLMFSPNGRLALPPSLQSAQAMCLLSLYEYIVDDEAHASGSESAASWSDRYRDLTLHILQALKLHTPEYPMLTPVPSQAYVQGSIEQECARRIFWVVFMTDCLRSVYWRRNPDISIPPSTQEGWKRDNPQIPPGTDSFNRDDGPSNNWIRGGSMHVSYSPPGHHGQWPNHYNYPSVHTSPQQQQVWGSKPIEGPVSSNPSFSSQHSHSPYPPHGVHANSTEPHHYPPTSYGNPRGAVAVVGGVIGYQEGDLKLRLPADEVSFDLGTVHERLPEYLHLPAVRMGYSSELGHMIRVISIYHKVEWSLDDLFSDVKSPSVEQISEPNSAPDEELNGQIESSNSAIKRAAACALIESARWLDEWFLSLPTHLQFSQEMVDVHQSMLETASNTSAWCFASLHVYHAICALALGVARQYLQRSGSSLPMFTDQNNSQEMSSATYQRWASKKLDVIITMIGEKAKSSWILGALLWALLKYCQRGDEPKIQAWVKDFEDNSGMDMERLTANRWGAQGESILRSMKQTTQPPPNNSERSTASPSSVSSATYPLGRSFDELKLSSTPPKLTMDIDPILMNGKPPSQNGSLSSSHNSEGGSQHNLPSLKSQGLLDFNLVAGTPRNADAPSGADTARSMPVGLDWLANESR